MFVPADKEKARELGLPMTDGAAVVEYRVGSKSVFISYSFFGMTVDSHILAVGKSKLLLRQAVNVFCAEVFETFPYVEKIAGSVMKKSVENLLIKCGFVEIGRVLADHDGKAKTIKLMARFNNGLY